MTEISVDTATEFFVYRWFDSNGTLLYVGVTYDLERRRRNHRYGSGWFQFAARSEVATYPTWGAALQAESAAIAAESPVFNRTPDAGAYADRQREYLLTRGIENDGSRLTPPRSQSARRSGPKPTGKRRTGGIRVPLNDEEYERLAAWASATHNRLATFARDALFREVEKWERAEARARRES